MVGSNKRSRRRKSGREGKKGEVEMKNKYETKKSKNEARICFKK